MWLNNHCAVGGFFQVIFIFSPAASFNIIPEIALASIPYLIHYS
jgi:hypothetical protein